MLAETTLCPVQSCTSDLHAAQFQELCWACQHEEVVQHVCQCCPAYCSYMVQHGSLPSSQPAAKAQHMSCLCSAHLSSTRDQWWPSPPLLVALSYTTYTAKAPSPQKKPGSALRLLNFSSGCLRQASYFSHWKPTLSSSRSQQRGLTQDSAMTQAVAAVAGCTEVVSRCRRPWRCRVGQRGVQQCMHNPPYLCCPAIPLVDTAWLAEQCALCQQLQL